MDTLEDLDASIETLMAEVTVIQERIRALRERRNALVPIYRLPAEVLTHVFRFLQVMVFTRKKDSRTAIPFVYANPGWLRVTYVCRHFREVAEQEGSLWAVIDLRWHGEFVSLCIERARSHPLGFHAELRNIHESNMKRFNQIVLTAQNLELWDTREAHFLFAKLLPQSMPQLRGLAYTPAVDYVLGQSFLRDCQMLTTLEIYDTFLDYTNTFYFPELLSLRMLSFVQIGFDKGVQALYNILSKTPNLETLVMDTVDIFDLDIDLIEDARYKSQMSVSLPALREMRVESRVLFACVCLRVLPEPFQRLEVELLDYETLTHRRIQDRYTAYYHEVFDRVTDFWKRKTGQDEICGQFYHICGASCSDNSEKSYVRFGISPGAYVTPTISYRTPVDIRYTFSFWSHVSTLHLQQKGSTGILYLDDIVSLSGLSLVIVDISDPDTKDMRNLRSWILDQMPLDGPPIDVEFPADCSEAWKEFYVEMKDKTPRVRLFVGLN
jgi:hypothetical protein